MPSVPLQTPSGSTRAPANLVPGLRTVLAVVAVILSGFALWAMRIILTPFSL